MKINGATALVTGANRGLGREFVTQLRERGATKVYATARDPRTVTDTGAVALTLDLLDEHTIAAAAATAQDVTLLINNAGVFSRHDLMSGDLAVIRQEMDTNFFGTLGVTRAFADILGRNDGGAIINVLSALSWFSVPGAASYAASKAAAWSLTAGSRTELAGQGTQVLGLHLGAADTDMMRHYDGPRLEPAAVVRAALDGLEAGAAEILVDEWSRVVKAGLSRDPADFYAEVAASLTD